MSLTPRKLFAAVLLLSPFAIAAVLIWPDVLGSLFAGRYNDAADFQVFYDGARLFGEGRFTDLWTQERLADVLGRPEDRFLWFAYPPFYARSWLLLTGLGIDAAFVVWTIAGLAALAAAVRVAAGRWDLAAIALGLAWYPAAINFELGQNAAFGALIVAVSVGLVRSGRHIAGGALLGLLVYKPQLAIGLGVWWLLDRRFRPAGWSALASAGLVLATSLLVDATAWAAYREALSELAGQRGQILQVSLAGFADLALADWTLGRTVGTVAGAAVLAWFGWWVARRQPSFELAAAAAIVVTVLSAPYLIVYDYLIAVGPAVILIRSRPLPGLMVPAVLVSWSVLYTYVVLAATVEAIGVAVQILPLATLTLFVGLLRLVDDDAGIGSAAEEVAE